MYQMKIVFESDSAETTSRIGKDFGQRLRGGEILVLDSDLGGGKTTFTQGVARGLGSEDSVTSPTFTISQVYRGEKLTLHHFDFYRLNEMGILSDELAEVLEDSKAVCVIEWPEAAYSLLPDDRLIRISFKKDAERETWRHIEVEVSELLSYTLPHERAGKTA